MPRKAAKQVNTAEENEEALSSATGEQQSAPAPRRGRAAKKANEPMAESAETISPPKKQKVKGAAQSADEEMGGAMLDVEGDKKGPATTRKGRKPKVAIELPPAGAELKGKDNPESASPKTSAPSTKRKAKGDSEKVTSPKSPAEKVLIERSKIDRNVPKGKSFKVISWNVTTLRSLVNKNADMLKNLIKAEQPDLLCIQEIKLNQEDQEEYDRKLKEILPGCTLHWNFCTLPESKSYAGTLAIVFGSAGGSKGTIDSFFAKKGAEAKAPVAEPVESKKVVNVVMNLPTLSDADGNVAKEFNAEGRTITIEYDDFFVVACYVPNSGDKLQRLEFRTKIWDRKIREYLVSLEKKKPVIFCGDLNVAHLDEDIWNVGAKHLSKSAGTTPEERASFSDLLSLGFVDAFRKLNPAASGWFSYWSVRAGNQPFNRGLRLDYFVTSPSLYPESTSGASSSVAGKPAVKDVAILTDFVAIDHAAIALTLAL